MQQVQIRVLVTLEFRYGYLVYASTTSVSLHFSPGELQVLLAVDLVNE